MYFYPSGQVDARLKDWTRRLRLHRCEWTGCAAVLDSVERLERHVLKNHVEVNPRKCEWNGHAFGPIFSKSELIKHIVSRHTRANVSCPYQACSKTGPPAHILNHTNYRHKDDRRRPIAKITPLVPTKKLPPLPNIVPSYTVYTGNIYPSAIPKARHTRLGLWVLRRIVAPSKPLAGTVNAAHRPKPRPTSKSLSTVKPQEGDFAAGNNEVPSRMSSPLQQVSETQYDFLPDEYSISRKFRDLTPDPVFPSYSDADIPPPGVNYDAPNGATTYTNKLDGNRAHVDVPASVGKAAERHSVGVTRGPQHGYDMVGDLDEDTGERLSPKSFTPQDIDKAFEEFDRARGKMFMSR